MGTLAIAPPSLFRRTRKLLSLISRFYRHDDGATATEYAMLVVFIALAIAIGAQALGNAITGLFTNMGSTLTQITIPTP